MANPWDNDPIYKPLAKSSASAGNPWDNDPIVSGDAAAPKADQGILKNLALGGLRGVTNVIDTGAGYLSSAADALTGGNERARVDGMNKERAQIFMDNANTDSMSYKGGELVGEIGATWGVGGLLGQGAKAVGLERLGNALASSGMSTGGTVAKGIPGKALDLGIRSAGGAITGAASAGMVNPDSMATGAVVGGVLPPALKAMHAAGGVVGGAVRPFFSAGQDKIVRNALSEFADNPTILSGLKDIPEVVSGSAPTSVMAAGDTGLAGLSRTMQASNPKYASDLAARQSAQNAARTSAMEEMAGNTGKITVAKEARDAATGSLRDEVLARAGNVPVDPVLSSIDRLTAHPDNAGKLSQQALNEYRNRIASFTKDGAIDARALYAIRKDINDTLSGKLQGESGNLKYASGQLIGVKGLIDDAIDKASRAVTGSTSREVAPLGSNLGMSGAGAAQGPQATWKQYLTEYSNQSKPIEQMEILDDVLKRVQTGSVDSSGNAIISAAKLNNLLKNDTPDLIKKLSPEQLAMLRNVAADLNASQLAMNSGKSVGSDTVQKLATNNMLTNMLGAKLGGSSPAMNTLGRLMQVPYGTANKQIMEKMGNALLDPQEMARIMKTPEGNKLMQLLTDKTGKAAYRVSPLIAGQ